MAARAQRSDAARNRSQILDAAAAAWARSSDATMQSIARAAGIGQGTLYRHFPTRESLLLAVYRDEFAGLLAAATALLESEPRTALRSWLDRLAEFGRTKHALSDAFAAAARSELHEEQYDRIVAAIDALLAAGRRAGDVRADVDAVDVLHLTGFLWHTDTAAEPRLPHLLDLVVDALRPAGRDTA